jgi:Raf kinase inhibitor-like YbhB/YbcL family protein
MSRSLRCWAAAFLVLCGCPGRAPDVEPDVQGKPTMQLTSPAFREGGTIPKVHTCDGTDLSPRLEWKGAPDGAKCFALICDDPDAPRGTWVHWVLYNLPSSTHALPEGVSAEKGLPAGARKGVNDFGKTAYGGPCPPKGKPHRYIFKLYALDSALDLKEGATKQQLVEAMKGHILADGQLMGTYGR